uniref:Uncharacterized protein n=1 Tax=Rhizophora mucronata TaxID=61149 RepID=A0A2P2PFU2_RHIMU
MPRRSSSPLAGMLEKHPREFNCIANQTKHS